LFEGGEESVEERELRIGLPRLPYCTRLGNNTFGIDKVSILDGIAAFEHSPSRFRFT
jgi:hypothetical protein